MRTYITLPISERFWPKVHKTDGCWLWTGVLNEHGYGVLHGPGKRGQNILAHRLAYQLSFGLIADGLSVCHRCDIPACVNPNHLFLGTHKDNMQDALRKGKWQSKITVEQSTLIRKLLAFGVPQRRIAKQFGVSQRLICRLNRNMIATYAV